MASTTDWITFGCRANRSKFLVRKWSCLEEPHQLFERASPRGRLTTRLLVPHASVRERRILAGWRAVVALLVIAEPPVNHMQCCDPSFPRPHRVVVSTRGVASIGPRWGLESPAEILSQSVDLVPVVEEDRLPAAVAVAVAVSLGVAHRRIRFAQLRPFVMSTLMRRHTPSAAMLQQLFEASPRPLDPKLLQRLIEAWLAREGFLGQRCPRLLDT
jgi:hypothetical protein